MTGAAQQAMRRTMEMYSATTRFALACNISTKIIEPIQSRCAILRYSRLSDEEILARLEVVCGAEDVGFSPEGLRAVVFTAEGDMRHALNNLQSTVSGFGYVSPEHVFKVCDQPHPVTVREIISACAGGDIYTALDKLQALWGSGYSAQDIIGTIFRVVRSDEELLSEEAKLSFIRDIGFTHMRVAEGSASLLQLQGLVATLCDGQLN